jgi:hypothetical protein
MLPLLLERKPKRKPVLTLLPKHVKLPPHKPPLTLLRKRVLMLLLKYLLLKCLL